MKILANQLTKAVVSVAAAVLLTLLVGGMLGFPENPAAFKARQRQLTALIETNPVTTPAETDAIFNTPPEIPSSPAPPEAVAIIQWHAFILGIFSFLAFLIARVKLPELAMVTLLAVTLLALTVGPVPATFVLVAAICYVLLTLLFPGLYRVAA